MTKNKFSSIYQSKLQLLLLYLNNLRDKYIFLIIMICVFLIYLSTTGKSLITLDNGEFAATSYFLGLPHPPGYPLFTIIGFFISHLPIGMRVIEKLNLLSSIYSFFCVYFLIKFLILFITYLDNSFNSKFNKFKNVISPTFRNFLSIVSGLIFAFSKTFWYQSTNYEVYTFQMFLVSGLIYFSLKAYFEEKSTDLKNSLNKNWCIAFLFFTGILTNHPTGLFFVILTFILFFSNGFTKQRVKFIFIFLTFTLMFSLLIYLYIPLRTSQKALAGFGLPLTFSEILNHITAKVYSTFLFSSSQKFIDNLSLFINSLWVTLDLENFYGYEFGFAIFLFPIGIFSIVLINRKIFWMMITLLIFYIILPASYGVYDIDSFFIYAYFLISIFIAGGIYVSFKLTTHIHYKIPVLILLVTIVTHQIYLNYKKVDQSNNFMVENYFKKTIENLEPGSILINFSSWFHSMSLYFQFVEKFRPDVIVILFPLTSEKWYLDQIQQWYKVQEKIINLDNGQIKLNPGKRKIYFTIEMVQKISSGNIKIEGENEMVPFGLCFKLTPRGTYIEQKLNMYEIGQIKKNYVFSDEIEGIIYQMILYRIYYELDHGYEFKAKKLIELIQHKFPEQSIPSNLLKIK